MKHAEIRQQAQLDFVASGVELELGSAADLPLPLEELKQINEHSQYVRRYIAGGLTAEVYKLEIEGCSYTLKKKRAEALVRNVDGQTSFLNEVQRRLDFHQAKQVEAAGLESVIDTIYASYRHGIIFSPWVEGDEVEGYNQEILENLFYTLLHMEKAGVFECDLCNGNILIRPCQKVKFFDFGYAYRFDPLTEINSDGLERPEFHMAERFETRSFMQHLCDIEQVFDKTKALELYRLEKQIALKYYQQKQKWLVEQGASDVVLKHIAQLIQLWQQALTTEQALQKLYALDLFRSFLLDLEDDVRGKSCNSDTLTKGEKVLQALQDNYEFLKANKAFIVEDQALSQQGLVDKYSQYLELAQKYQLKDLKDFNEWKQRRMNNIKSYY